MIRGFITNLGKYNEGELIGRWMDFPISDEELEAVYEEIGINEEYEEIFFTGWESDIEGVADYFGEYANIEEVNEIAETIDSYDSYEQEMFEAICEVWGLREAIESNIDDYNIIQDASNDYDIGYYWIEESGCYDTKALGALADYIDYEAFGRDIRLEEDGGFCSTGFIYKM